MLEPLASAPALMFGHAMHTAMEHWYNALAEGRPTYERVKLALKAFEEEMNIVQDQYDYHETFLTDLQRGQNILRAYGLQYPNERWKVLGTEIPMEVEFSTGDVLTGRADLIVESQENRRYLIDHKFTGWSMLNVKKSLQNSNQATAYKLLWDTMNPDKPIHAAIFNICRAYKNSTEFHQLAVMRTYKDVEEFKLDTEYTMKEMAERIADENARWPKNTDRCMDFNRPCPYLPICQGTNYESLLGLHYKIKEVPSDS